MMVPKESFVKKVLEVLVWAEGEVFPSSCSR